MEKVKGSYKEGLVDAEKMSFGASKQLRKFRTRKLPKIVNCATIKETERNNGGGPSGIGGWPLISSWIIPLP